MRMQRVTCKAGEVVIKQGDDGDYFYVITEGRCLVTRETPLSRDGLKLAELRVGDRFGEEALISGRQAQCDRHDADGRRARAARQGRLQQLLNEPMLSWVELRARAGDGRAGRRWLDVRLPSEFEPSAPRERDERAALLHPAEGEDARQRRRRTSSVCDTGRRSSAAAFMLSRTGIRSLLPPGRHDGATSSAPARKKINRASERGARRRRVTSCAWHCRRRARRRDRTRSSSGSCRGPAR